MVERLGAATRRAGLHAGSLSRLDLACLRGAMPVRGAA
jgi:hypothetical protein